MKTTDGYVENMDGKFYEDGSPFLSHYGVLGMKWGVRNADTRARYSREHRATKARKAEQKGLKSKRLSARESRKKMSGINKEKTKAIKEERLEANRNRSLLSDSELQQRVRRLQLERQLNDLTQAELQPGRYAVKSALTKVGSDLIKSETKSVVKDTLHPGKK